MRQQFHFWPAATGPDYDAWDVHRLVELSAGLPVHPVEVTTIRELDTDYWTDDSATPRKVAAHVRLILDVDPSYPVILGPDGRVMDGMHRLVRALVEGRAEVDAVTFPVLPEPDHRNVRVQDLP